MQKMIVANWKMHLGIRESVALAKAAVMMVQGRDTIPQIVLCPASTALYEVHKILARTRLALGAQDAGPDRYGSFTGAVGVGHLEDVGAAYVILGHSERRTVFGETDEMVREKLQAVGKGANLTPIVCVGESKAEHDAGKAVDTVVRMLKRSCAAIDLPRGQAPVFAYEPVWAIGTKQTPAVHDALEVIRTIKDEAKKLFPSAGPIRVLYGGSVDADNAYVFLREPDVDGVLVGGASLKVREFEGIVKAACEVLSFQEGV